MKKTFYLGLGAQKAGTTWLFRQVQNSPRFAPGLCKEYHLFDGLYLGAESARANAERRVSNYKFGDPSLSHQGKVELIDRFYDDESQYFDYLAGLLSQPDSFTCDITPAYALLDSQALAFIKEEFERRDIEIRVIYLMREPVSRLESELRMSVRRNRAFDTVQTTQMEKRMNKMLSLGFPQKSNYSFTVGQIDEVFSPSQVFYCFYEELFQDSNLEKLAEFFDFPRSALNPEQKVNVSRCPYRYSEQQLNEWIEKFRDEYSFAESRFGFDSDIWRSTLLKKLGAEAAGSA